MLAATIATACALTDVLPNWGDVVQPLIALALVLAFVYNSTAQWGKKADQLGFIAQLCGRISLQVEDLWVKINATEVDEQESLDQLKSYAAQLSEYTSMSIAYGLVADEEKNQEAAEKAHQQLMQRFPA